MSKAAQFIYEPPFELHENPQKKQTLLIYSQLTIDKQVS